MAKKKKPAGKLAGKKVAFVGKLFGYFVPKYHGAVATAGGTVVESATSTTDYLVFGEGRGGKPPGEVARLQKQFPQLQALDLPSFFRLLVPDRDELLQGIRNHEVAAPSEHDPAGWDRLEEMMNWGGATVDLSGADLRDTNLYAAKLERMTLDGADLRGAKMEYAHADSLRGVNLDRINGPNVYLANAVDCTFREANLEKVWAFHGSGKLIERCDFSDARMPRARLGSYQGIVRACTFQRADLRGAGMERTTFEQVDFRDADLTGVLASEASFTQTDFRGAKLGRADLRNAVLTGADLRGADLRDATLNDADLTGAKVEGAHFTGAVLGGANLTGVDVSKARNLAAPLVRQPGPKLLELAAVASAASRFETSAEVDLGPGQYAKLRLDSRNSNGALTVHARSAHFRGEDDVGNWIAAPTFERGMLNLADRWPGATLRLDTVTAKGGRLRGQRLLDLAVTAWSEVFGVQKSADELALQQDEQADAARAELRELIAKMRTEGASAWESIDFRLRDRFTGFSGADLRGADLNGVNLDKRNFRGCQFQQASLVGVWLYGSDLRDCDFTGAELHGVFAYQADCRAARFANARMARARFEKADLTGAELTGADLTDADLSGANLNGADLTGSTLTNTNLSGAQYDPDTRLPTGFTPPPDMIWNGLPRPVVAAHAPGSLDFPRFIAGLNGKIDPERLRKVVAMLRKETFQLFAATCDEALVGVVRSQSEDERAYSCRLASDGSYCCATQNLKPCGGLRGGLCKHLLVLIVALTRSGELDPATVDAWIDASRSRKAVLDKDALSETFVRYQAAQGSDVDWRPTLTVPEDYRAL